MTSPPSARSRSVDIVGILAPFDAPEGPVYTPPNRNGRLEAWVTPTYFFRRERHTAVNREEERDAMSRDFVGALLQLNAEKQVSREQLIRTVEDAIAAAYRRVANEEDIHVQIDADSGAIRV